MNWLKNLLNNQLNRFKSDINREIDRAISKLESGESQTLVVNELQSKVSTIVSKVKLPQPLGAILIGLLLVFDWSELTSKPTQYVIEKLKELKEEIKGKRF
jgi:hypothetical protein